MNFEFSVKYNFDLKEISLESILNVFKGILVELLEELMQGVLIQYAEYLMDLSEKPFSCRCCGNNEHFSWKTHKGKPTQILTFFRWITLRQLQIRCGVCGHKFYILRKLLGLEPLQRIPKTTIRELALTGALASFRVSKKILSFLGCVIDKMTIWRAVQKVGPEIEFDLDEKELAEGEADGTGIPIQNIKKRGKELKVFVQRKNSGGIRIAGLSIGDYHSGWDKLFKPLVDSFRKFGNTFVLVTDGDDNILKWLKDKVDLVIQRCLWHIPHQMKYTLWQDKVKRKSDDWLYILSAIIEICMVKKVYEEQDVVEEVVKSKTESLEYLILYCQNKGYARSASYLETAKPDMFKLIGEKLYGKTTSLVERVMRTVNLRINVGKWSQKGALSVNKIRLAYYYNGWDV